MKRSTLHEYKYKKGKFQTLKEVLGDRLTILIRDNLKIATEVSIKSEILVRIVF